MVWRTLWILNGTSILFDKHLLDESERRFIVEDENQVVGIIELVEINYIHCNCEIQIIIKPEFSGKGYAKFAFEKAINYAFDILNMHKIYLYVDTDNKKAVHIFESQGFKTEGLLKEQLYTKVNIKMPILCHYWNMNIFFSIKNHSYIHLCRFKLLLIKLKWTSLECP